MSNREEDREEGREEENTGSISYNNPIRGYSSRHSSYDNAYNMDFEYSYIDFLTSYGLFVSKAQETYSNIEKCMTKIIESQDERRRLATRRHERARYNRVIREHQYIVSDNGRDRERGRDRDVPNVENSTGTSTFGTILQSNIHADRIGREPRESREIINNLSTHATTAPAPPTPATPSTSTRRQLFDPSSFIYTTPRTFLLPSLQTPSPFSNLYNTSSRRRTSEGLTIREIEENTEITTYNSIPSNDILNTECPITRETFTPESVVLKLKRCKHCFIPFRMMVWLETHSTCPLCRCDVVQAATGVNIPENNEDNYNEENSNEDNSNEDNYNEENYNEDNYNEANHGGNNSISDIFSNILQSNNREFNNLSIDNVNDNSIVFSFDLPASHVNSQNTNNNPFIIPQIERLIANTVSRNIFNNSTSSANETPPDYNNDNNDNNDNDDNDYPEVD